MHVGCAGGSREGPKREEIYRLLLPCVSFLSLPPRGLGAGSGPRRLYSGFWQWDQVPLGSEQPRRSEPGAEGRLPSGPEPQRGKGGPSNSKPSSYYCLLFSQVGIGGPMNLVSSSLGTLRSPKLQQNVVIFHKT